MSLRSLIAVVVAAAALHGAVPTRAQTLIDPKLLDPNTWYGMAGRALTSAIQVARDEALKAGTRPIPPAMKTALSSTFPPELLERVTWRVGNPNGLAAQALQTGHIQAMTFIDVIVFQKEEDALGNAGLWAHELTHVRQYDRWGVEEFARRYAEDFNAIEDEAYAFQAEFEKKSAGTRPAG